MCYYSVGICVDIWNLQFQFRSGAKCLSDDLYVSNTSIFGMRSQNFVLSLHSKINVSSSSSSSMYGLYFYNEGMLPVDVTKIKLNGAPVIFVPGNGGSYKQVRSLASVALKKGIGTSVNLDYYTVDFNEELSALFGNYLERQTQYLKECIEVVLRLYASKGILERKVVLIGHSMGALVAHGVLRESEASKHINTIIALSSPLQNPVLNLDKKIDAFYREIHNYLSKVRSFFEPKVGLNFCGTSLTRRNSSQNIDPILNNILLISIGGGNRDLLVPSGLTISRFSDIHSITASIPYVWVSCDHLSSVWCLQLVLVVNRFIFNITMKDSQNNSYFIKDRYLREQVAYRLFVKPKILEFREKYVWHKVSNNTIWHEDLRRIISKTLKKMEHNFIQLIPVSEYSRNQKLYIETIQFGHGDFLFGCAVESNLNKSMFCKDGTSLSHHFQILPTVGNKLRYFAILDINNLKETYANWTHIGLHISAARNPKMYNVDIYNATDRQIHLKVPRWPYFRKTILIKESSRGALYYKLLISGLEETHTTMELKIEPVSCVTTLNTITIKMCIPFAQGFSKYKTFRPMASESFYVNIPVVNRSVYNKLEYPISLEFFVDSSCRYQISYTFSYAATMSRIVQQYYQWLPSHLIAIVLIVLKTQIWKFHGCSNGKEVLLPYSGYFQYNSFFIIMGCRILSRLLRPADFISPNHGMSIHLIVIIHSTAIVLSIFSVLFLWSLLIVNAYGMSIVISWWPLRTTTIRISNTFPMLFGVFINALAIKTCGELALFVTCILYFFLILNEYNDYMENWTLRTALGLYKKAEYLPAEQKCPNEKKGSLVRFEGMKNFSFHISLFILLFIMASVNVMTLVAWIKDSSIVTPQTDPSLLSSLVVVTSLSILWSLNAPTKVYCIRRGEFDTVWAQHTHIKRNTTKSNSICIARAQEKNRFDIY
ncbi:GPI inositol-deacylase isoform X3 [Eurosta solidaginis]|uniref:GPI inositol-deacylase isoform X3 n=1 Tax=Eurosta solidaginis TaxID=178769 RepID=UPI0035307CC9